jgi:hypothetical protein
MSEEIPKDNGEIPIIRDDTTGRFVPGNPGGPGRPKGSISIIGRIKQIFEEDPEQFEAYVKEVMADKHLRRDIIEHIDKKPTQKIEVDGEIRHPLYLPGELLSKHELPSSPSTDSGGPTPVPGS